MAEEPVDHQAEARIRRSQTARVLVVLIIAAVLTGLALDNMHDVVIGWVFGSTTAPMVIVIVVSIIGGMAIGALARKRRT